MESSGSVKCVTLCLKSLFGLNLSGLMLEYIQQQLNSMPSSTETTNPSSDFGSMAASASLTSLASIGGARRHKTSLFAHLITNQLNNFSRYISSQSSLSKSDNLIQSSTDSSDFVSSKQTNLVSMSASSSSLTNLSTNKTDSAASTVSAPGLFKANPFSFFGFARKTQPEPASSLAANTKQNKTKKTDHKTITQYIKSFESIVIKSLRQYTFTTSANLQSRVLELLVQLVFLKVDYSLLDSDKVFINYVLKQFDYLEQRVSNERTRSTLEYESGAEFLPKSYLVDLVEGFDSETNLTDPIDPFDIDAMLNKTFSAFNNGQSGGVSGEAPTSPLVSAYALRQHEHHRNHLIIPKLFDFLILLSHEKRSSTRNVPGLKSSGLLTGPEVMQLCNNLIASDNSVHTHAIPALRPLVLDLFMNRSSEDNKELETQQDVIMKSMIKLIQYPQVWPLLTVAILRYKRENAEKWKRASRKICDALFDSMRADNLKLFFKEFNGFEMRAIRRFSRSYSPWLQSLRLINNLLAVLAPQVFRPIDFIVTNMFEVSKFNLVCSNIVNSEINSWLCVLIIHLHILVTFSNESQILIRLHHLAPQILASLESRDSSFGKSDDDSSGEEGYNERTSGVYSELVDEDIDDENELGLADAALFLAKFLLKVAEKLFEHLDKNIKFNSAIFFATNLAASAASAFLRDFQINSLRDLNQTEHLIANYLMYLMHILNSGSFPKVSHAFSLLINSKAATRSSKPKGETHK